MRISSQSKKCSTYLCLLKIWIYYYSDGAWPFFSCARQHYISISWSLYFYREILKPNHTTFEEKIPRILPTKRKVLGRFTTMHYIIKIKQTIQNSLTFSLSSKYYLFHFLWRMKLMEYKIIWWNLNNEHGQMVTSWKLGK